MAVLSLAACDSTDPMDAGSDAALTDAGTSPDAGTDAGARDAAADAGEDDSGPDGGPDSSVSIGCLDADGADPSGTDVYEDGARATVTVTDRDACLRSYTLTTTATLRDGRPDNPRTVPELDGWPTTRTGHDWFDALHALALEEVRENSVSAVRDGAFDEGRAVDCGEGGCFETGQLWNYVWTRDTAYSVDLGLAHLDPTRARNSLTFKLSERRGGGDLQIVQDTGSGGSYPVSTDRVAWALGARELLNRLTGTERNAFRDRAYEALANTLEHDRRLVHDPDSGLYSGEQSFLDWREQTYPEWTGDDVVHIGMSRALSTNLLHLSAMELAADLATERGETDASARYQGWADSLRTAIRTELWLEDEGQFSTFITTGLDPAPVRRFDLLGASLAVLLDVADEAQADRMLEGYPHYGPGAPVIWPQQQGTRIYHNRGEWPFVTAYWLRAAQHADQPAVADRMVRALMRGAALNLSNMENFEAASGEPWFEDGDVSGPVVNSQRQLWSVAAYVSLVHHTIFGLSAEPSGLRVAPYVTSTMRDELFSGTDSLVLNDYPFRGRRVTVRITLPESAGTGSLEVASVRLNGATVDGLLEPSALAETNLVEVELTSGTGDAGAITVADTSDFRNVYGPRTPRVTGVSESGGRVVLALSTGGDDAADVRFRVYRDGVTVADDLPGTTTSWTDPDFDATSERSPCYVAELTFASSGTHSQHSPPMCWWGAGATRVSTIDASTFANVGGTGSSEHGRFHYGSWGDPGHALTASGFVANQSGEHLIQVTFGNGAGAIQTGITCAVKRVRVVDEASGDVVGEGMIMMPHLATWSRWEDSSFVSATLTAGRSYRIVVRSDDEMVNMSSFAHFEPYTGGLGGRSGTFNRVNIADIKVLAR
ncbi:MAG: hypothetical protein AB8I08_33095 [Sandaracinaceae bacterium]